MRTCLRLFDGEWNAGATRYRNHKDLPPKGSTIPRSSRKSKEEHTHFGDGRPHGFWERLFPFRAQRSGGAVCVVQCRRGGLAGPELLGGAGLENLLSHGPGLVAAVLCRILMRSNLED